MSLQLELGLTCWKPDAGWTADALCEQALWAESTGFHSYWLPENHFDDPLAMPSPLTQLAAVAARTRRIGLGTVSYLIPIRPPLLAAEEVAVLDQLSGGRVILGVGRGIQGAMFKAFELPTKDKRKRFAQNLDVMRRAWAGESVAEDADGNPVYLAPLPVQRPSPPIWVAAFGPLALKQVASLGLPYLASPIESLDTLRENYQRQRQMMVEENLDPVETVPVMRTVFVSEDTILIEKLKQALADTVPRIARSESVAVEEWTIIGDAAYVRDKLHEYGETLGMTHLIASGRLPGIDSETLKGSHRALLELVS